MSFDANLQIINCRKRVWVFYYYVKQFTYPENENYQKITKNIFFPGLRLEIKLLSIMCYHEGHFG